MLRTDRDMILCILWIVTYMLVFIGTKKHKYPLISPVTQLFIASLEFSVLYQLIIEGAFGNNHIGMSYACWAVVEILIIVMHIKQGFIPKKFIGAYVTLMVVLTVVMCYLVANKGYGFFFNYFNTFVGEVIWLLHVKKEEYPMKPIVLLLFVTKFLADVLGVSVYWGRGSWVTNIVCIALPVLDFIFIHEFFSRASKANDMTHEKQLNTDEKGAD